jgi:hypothetical protein
MPCGDKDDCNEANHSELTTQKEHHEHQDEACTPFCVCSCCTTHILHANENNTTTILTEIASVYTQQLGVKLPTTVTPIWQPPKLSC